MPADPPEHRPIDVAYTLHVHGRLAEAEARYRAIIRDDPAGPDGMDARNNLLDVFRAQHRWPEAQELVREALAVRPGDADWSFRLGNLLLAEGRYAEGWPLYEARRAISRNRVPTPRLSFPEWRGERVASLLIWPEQGLGDVIQFSRFLPPLRKAGIVVTLACAPSLVRLLAPLADQVIALQRETTVPHHDAWSLIGSLPLRFGTTLETIPAPALPQAPASASAFGGARIGLVTRGSPTHFNDANRSLPAEIAAELLARPGVVSLHPEDTGAADFLDTARIIEGLDEVISVDTAPAHLAASMGKPTRVLLPYLNPDWRWLRGRADSPWYPSARLYRQPAAGDWRSAVEAALGDPRP